MNFDEEVPPELVEAETSPQEEKLVKVPITIVTGKLVAFTIHFSFSNTISRLSWCWEDHALKLHINCPAWQEDCCHHE